jgi:hypothetical protein
MPVRKQGRYVETTPEELNAWLGKESGKPVHVATDNTDLGAELKRGLTFVRDEKQQSKLPASPKRGTRVEWTGPEPRGTTSKLPRQPPENT